MATYIKLEWWNSCDLGRIYYQGGFKNKLFLDASIGRPDYAYEAEEQQDGDGAAVKNYEKLEKLYKIETYQPEYVVDALQAMQLHDNIRISLTDGSYSSTIRNVKVNATWEDISNQCMALVEITFQQDDQIIRDNCCNNMS